MKSIHPKVSKGWLNIQIYPKPSTYNLRATQRKCGWLKVRLLGWKVSQGSSMRCNYDHVFQIDGKGLVPQLNTKIFIAFFFTKTDFIWRQFSRLSALFKLHIIQPNFHLLNFWSIHRSKGLYLSFVIWNHCFLLHILQMKVIKGWEWHLSGGLAPGLASEVSANYPRIIEIPTPLPPHHNIVITKYIIVAVLKIPGLMHIGKDGIFRFWFWSCLLTPFDLQIIVSCFPDDMSALQEDVELSLTPF